MTNDRFDRDRLVTEADRPRRRGRLRRGRPGRRVSTSCSTASPTEARLNELGVEIAAGDVVNYLANRLGITAWRRRASRDRGRRDRSAHRHRRPAPHRHHDPATTCWPSIPSLPRPAHMGGRPSAAAARDGDVRHRSPHRRGRRDVWPWPTRSSPGSPASTRWARRSHRSASASPAGDFRSMIFPIQFRVPTYNQLAAPRGRPRARRTAGIGCSCSTCSRATRRSSGCSSRPPTCGISTSSPASTPMRSSCRPTATRSRSSRRRARWPPTCGAWPATTPTSPRSPPTTPTTSSSDSTAASTPATGT